MVEIRNETPLEISISSRQLFKPLEVAEHTPGDDVAKLTIFAPTIRYYGYWLPKNALPPIVTIDVASIPRTILDPANEAAVQQFCAELPALKQRGANELRVSNDTIHVVEVRLVDRAGGRLMGRIAPGESWEHPAAPRLLWHFRTPSGLTLGMWVHPGTYLSYDEPNAKPPFHVRLTTEYLDAWRAYQKRPPGTSNRRGATALGLIGEKRASTPGPDDQQFISAATVRVDISKEPFNGLENRVVRDVEIAGPLLRWSGANRILSGYYGESAADIRSLTISCDRMEVADHLRFPRTNVTIHARELVFTGHGKIDTTPLPYPGRARSKYLTEHPDDPGLAELPADEAGEPTYKPADGRKGEPGGSITVFARTMDYVEDPANSAPWLRFFTCGGKGQQGEAGGLKAYVRGEGQPEKYGPLPPVKADDVARSFKDAFKLECWHFRWPGGVDWPSQVANVWQGNVVEVSVFAYSGGLWLRYLHLPSQTHKAGLPRDVHPGEPTAPRRCNHRDAYAGGWPGAGGDGGSFTLVTERAETADRIASIRDEGAMGEPTLPVKGDAADRTAPQHLWLLAVDKEIASSESPRLGLLGGGAISGKEAFGRAGRPPAHELKHDRYLAWTNGSVVDLQSHVFETRPNTGQRGAKERAVRSDLSWAHPAAMTAVLSYARTAYRNGFRDEAARALAPYYALTVLRVDAVAQCAAEVRMAFASVVALNNNLALDVDYYGNPPGWVPRLNALSNLSVLKTVREAAYGTYYFADRMLKDAEALEDLRETAVMAQAALKIEMQAAKQKLQTAYDQLPAAMDKLNRAQKSVVGVEEQIVALRKEAIARSADQVMVRRFVSAALQMVDGVAKSLPVGQPFAGLAGSLFGAAAKIDWTAEKPLETAGAAVAHLSEQVDGFVTKKADAVASAVTGRLRGTAIAGEDLVTRLTREQEDAAKEPAEAVAQVEVAWQQFKSDEHKRLEAKIKLTEEAIAKAKSAATDDGEVEGQTASEFLTALQKQKELMNPKRAVALQVKPLQDELVQYRKQQFAMIDAAEKTARLKRAELKALAETPKHLLPPTVEQKLTAATRRSEDQKRRVERAEATAKETMTQLEGLGTGLASIGDAIVAMATPVSSEDPTIERLADEMLVSDPVLRAAGQRLAQALKGLLEDKRAAVGELLRWQQQATTSLATVTRNLATMSELGKQRQSIDLGLNPAAKAYLKETRDAAKDALAESIYWFVKSYQYEFLQDVADSFFNSDSWARALHEQEKVKQAAAPSDVPAVEGPVATRAATPLLSQDDFERIGNGVFKAEQLRLGMDLLAERQKRRPDQVGEYMNCELVRTAAPKDERARRQNELLDALEQGEAAIDFVRDFDKGSYDWNNARVVQVKLVRLDIEASDPSLTLTFRVQQRGEMIVGRKVGSERRQFLFRTGRDDDPVGWTFVYNHRNRKTDSGITVPKVVDPLGDVAKGLISEELKLEEYQPALFSDYVIRITDLFGARGERKGLTRVSGLNMTVYLSGG